ncbi:MAG: OmpA family protein, partial [Myxococcota bacterium]
TDGDGVIDDKDKCINEPETENGYQDSDGCPDEIPEIVKKFTGSIKGINFQSGRSTINPTSFPVLDKAVVVLKDYPDLKLEIGGHTDSSGSARGNQRLSQRRADAVRAYLIGQGIDASRLTAVGYGEAKPIATNRTRAGRAENRRIEFVLND